jgi:peptidyl-tRNA hydrolase
MLIQYIVVRSDLKSWPLGALIAQGCHASVAAIAASLDHPSTIEYIADSANMTKCVLGIPDEAQLRSLAERLQLARVSHHLWIEQPENIAVALATAPANKSDLAAHFKDLKLLK